VKKSRRKKWAECVVGIGEKRNAYRFCWGNMKERDHFVDLGVDGMVTLK
jgi:hypothetical protein